MAALIDRALQSYASLELETGVPNASPQRLIINLKNDVASRDEAARLLTELKHAWETLEQRDKPAVAVPVEPLERRPSMSLGKA